MSNVGLQTIPEWRYITPNTKIFIQNASVEIGGAYSPGAGPDFIRMNQRGSARKSSIDLDTVPATADPGKPFDIEKAIDKDPDSLRLLCWPQQAHQEEYSAMRESHTPPSFPQNKRRIFNLNPSYQTNKETPADPGPRRKCFSQLDFTAQGRDVATYPLLSALAFCSCSLSPSPLFPPALSLSRSWVRPHVATAIQITLHKPLPSSWPHSRALRRVFRQRAQHL